MTPRCRRVHPGANGFGIVELLISTTLLRVVIATAFKVVNPAEGAFRVEPEATDVQQRLRVATDAITDALDAAGAGPTQGYQVEPMIDSAPVLPMREGGRNPDPAEVFRPDVVTIVGAARGAAQSTIAQALPAASGPVQVNGGPGCPQGDPLCGFKAGMDVMVFDDTGAYDTFTIATVQGTVLNLQHNLLDTARVYPANTSRIIEVENKTLFLRTDVANNMLQLLGTTAQQARTCRWSIIAALMPLRRPAAAAMLKPNSIRSTVDRMDRNRQPRRQLHLRRGFLAVSNSGLRQGARAEVLSARLI